MLATCSVSLGDPSDVHVGTVRDYFLGELEGWTERQIDSDDDPTLFCLPLSPDRLHKANVSGGGPYGVVVPDGCVDGLWVGETTMPFVAYLNHVFSHGGFPGTVASAGAWRHRARLAARMLPL